MQFERCDAREANVCTHGHWSVTSNNIIKLNGPPWSMYPIVVVACRDSWDWPSRGRCVMRGCLWMDWGGECWQDGRDIEGGMMRVWVRNVTHLLVQWMIRGFHLSCHRKPTFSEIRIKMIKAYCDRLNRTNNGASTNTNKKNGRLWNASTSSGVSRSQVTYELSQFWVTNVRRLFGVSI